MIFQLSKQVFVREKAPKIKDRVANMGWIVEKFTELKQPLYFTNKDEPVDSLVLSAATCVCKAWKELG